MQSSFLLCDHIKKNFIVMKIFCDPETLALYLILYKRRLYFRSKFVGVLKTYLIYVIDCDQLREYGGKLKVHQVTKRCQAQPYAKFGQVAELCGQAHRPGSSKRFFSHLLNIGVFVFWKRSPCTIFYASDTCWDRCGTMLNSLCRTKVRWSGTDEKQKLICIILHL